MKPRILTMTAENALRCWEGTKTQTRRLMKPQPPDNTVQMEHREDIDVWHPVTAHGNRESYKDWEPRFRVGDAFYVGEPVFHGAAHVVRYKADGTACEVGRTNAGIFAKWIKADGTRYKVKSLPGRYMRRDWARMAGRITAVRAERVQDITEEDARAEGAWAWFKASGDESVVRACHELTIKHFPEQHDETGWNPCCRSLFAVVWEQIHGEDAWERNEWVWVYEFTIEARGHAEAQAYLREEATDGSHDPRT